MLQKQPNEIQKQDTKIHSDWQQILQNNPITSHCAMAITYDQDSHFLIIAREKIIEVFNLNDGGQLQKEQEIDFPDVTIFTLLAKRRIIVFGQKKNVGVIYITPQHQVEIDKRFYHQEHQISHIISNKIQDKLILNVVNLGILILGIEGQLEKWQNISQIQLQGNIQDMCLNELDNQIVVNLDKSLVIYKKDDQGNWKLTWTQYIPNLLSLAFHSGEEELILTQEEPKKNRISVRSLRSKQPQQYLNISSLQPLKTITCLPYICNQERLFQIKNGKLIQLKKVPLQRCGSIFSDFDYLITYDTEDMRIKVWK